MERITGNLNDEITGAGQAVAPALEITIDSAVLTADSTIRAMPSGGATPASRADRWR